LWLYVELSPDEVQVSPDGLSQQQRDQESHDGSSEGLGHLRIKGGTMHNKIRIIDGEIVCTGSANYSNGGFQSNDENITCINNEEIAKLYKYECLKFGPKASLPRPSKNHLLLTTDIRGFLV